MKKLLIVLMLVSLAFAANSQCNTSCTTEGETCTKPIMTPPQINNDMTMTVGWSTIWDFTPGQCGKGFIAVIDGVPYFHNTNMTWTYSVSSGVVPGFIAVPGNTYSVVIRNFCSEPWTCNPLDFIDSDPVLITAPVVVSSVPCKCGVKKYKITKDGFDDRCVNKIKCQEHLLSGWTSSCNCQ